VRVSRRRGEVRLRLDAVEVQVLSALLTEIAEAFSTDVLAADDPVRLRLLPDAYRDDDAAAEEFRSLTESALRTDRADRARRCVDELTNAGAAADGVDLHLDDDAGTRWITTLNDIRLALGTRLGITEDEPDDEADGDADQRDDDADEIDDDADAPEFQQRMLYYWLTGLQDSLVRALMP
jgi:hypothetical protein